MFVTNPFESLHGLFNVVWPHLSFLNHKVPCFCRYELGYVEPFKTLAALSLDYVTKHPSMHHPLSTHLSTLPTVKMNEIILLPISVLAGTQISLF
jgi:hypothetical protein